MELLRKRNRDSKKEQGGVGTLMAMRPTEEGGEKPTHNDVTWMADLIDSAREEPVWAIRIPTPCCAWMWAVGW